MVLAAGSLAAATAQAAPVTASHAFTARPLAGWVVVELRGGAQAIPAGPLPVICAEVAPYTPFALEACGTGAGFLFPQLGDEMVHFRAEANVPLLRRGRLDVLLQPGLGFSEIERGVDEPGFRFGPATSPEQREGAGPEASIGVKGRAWVHERVPVAVELTGGAAWVPSAPVVLGGGSEIVPFVLGTAGVGF
jgi:hypothetical protein